MTKRWWCLTMLAAFCGGFTSGWLFQWLREGLCP
jgi:hypothetical protein